MPGDFIFELRECEILVASFISLIDYTSSLSLIVGFSNSNVQDNVLNSLPIFQHVHSSERDSEGAHYIVLYTRIWQA